MTEYLTEKELSTLVTVGAVKAVRATVSVTRPGSWNLGFDLANGLAVMVGTARGDLKNYSLDSCAVLAHRLGVDRFTVGLHGYAVK